ncbi:hypothetical protein [Bradyrhizobium sp. USDA 4486]
MLAIARARNSQEAGERRQQHEQRLDRSCEEQRGKGDEDGQVVPGNDLRRKVLPERRNEQRHRDEAEIEQRRLTRDEIGGDHRPDHDQRAHEVGDFDLAGEEIAQACGGGNRAGIHGAPKRRMKCRA